ncbi:MAG: winged helix-turn-helix transcriptional regulator [Solirubrobacterales bacterium]
MTQAISIRTYVRIRAAYTATDKTPRLERRGISAGERCRVHLTSRPIDRIDTSVRSIILDRRDGVPVSREPHAAAPGRASDRDRLPAERERDGRVRAGSNALTLISTPLNVQVLKALENSPMPLFELRKAAGSPPQTTTRKQLRTLTDLGIIDRRREPGFPGSVEYSLAPAGADLMEVARATESWLAEAPDGPLDLGSLGAKSSLKALVDGWSTTIIRALATTPLSLTQLSRLIQAINYPSLERRISAMRLTGQIACADGAGRKRPYVATTWLRRAVAPLMSAMAWERGVAGLEAPPATGIDVEAMFLLTLPLLRLDSGLRGRMRMTVDLRGREGSARQAGVLARIEGGRVVACSSRLEGPADSWSFRIVGRLVRRRDREAVRRARVGR